MARMSSFLTISTAVLLLWLAWAGASSAQQSGGAFVPSASYTLSGVWTWTNASPWVYRPNPPAGFATTWTYTTPTANRTITVPNASGTLQLATTSVKMATGTGTLSSNPTSVTTGLSTISTCVVTAYSADVDILFPYQFSIITTAVVGRLDVYQWKPTSTSVTTPVAGTSVRKFNWVCFGN